MRSRAACAGITIGIVLAVSFAPAQAAENQRVSIEQLSWLAGCWGGAGGVPHIDEQWMTPLGGLMLGMGRTVKGGLATRFEQMQIREQAGSLVFTSRPSGQDEASFAAIEVTSSRVVFENKTHDFPQRIIYRRNDDRTLVARIAGEQAGKVSGFDFPMRRAACLGDH